jgi:ubiquinone/menaquinone biosynthesis C-methylase UbiE
MSDPKELAYRYDLFVTPDWRDRFDALVGEKIKLPAEGRVLDVNCGTGSHAIEMAEGMRGNGTVLGVDPSAERLELARAKAQVRKVKDVAFEQGSPSDLRFESNKFDIVIGDASMVHADQIEDMLAEMIRVAQPGALVVLKMATHGSFDEFFSIFWEALLDNGISDEVWSDLESLINERSTASDAEAMAHRAGLNHVQSFTKKEEFFYETASEFLESPLIKDSFLDEWLGIVPQERRQQVLDTISSIIDSERHNGPFELSIKATIVAGTK